MVIFHNDRSVVNCLVGEWSEWSSFTCERPEKLCGTCNKTRVKEVIREGKYGGKKDCEKEEETFTEERVCADDCEMDNWTLWTEWSCKDRKGWMQMENTGYRNRTQKVLKECRLAAARSLGPDCSCKMQIEEESREMPECGKYPNC